MRLYFSLELLLLLVFICCIDEVNMRFQLRVIRLCNVGEKRSAIVTAGLFENRKSVNMLHFVMLFIFCERI